MRLQHTYEHVIRDVEPITPEQAATVRQLLADHGALDLAEMLGVGDAH